MDKNKTHFRKAFDSPYLSSADIVGPTLLTIAKVELKSDLTKRSKEEFNTAYFVEKEIRQGEKLKPMILNAGNSKAVKDLADSPFIEDWGGIQVTVFVDKNVKFAKDIVEGLRIGPPKPAKPFLTPDKTKAWDNAKAAYKRDQSLEEVLKRCEMSEDHKALLISECAV